MTDAERRLWQVLRHRQFDGYRFRRQPPPGVYVVDFVCLEQRLIIEVDGAHHAEQAGYDDARDHWLRHQGFSVLRFSNRDVLTATVSVQEAILAALCADPSPSPSPARGEGTDGTGKMHVQ